MASDRIKIELKEEDTRLLRQVRDGLAEVRRLLELDPTDRESARDLFLRAMGGGGAAE